MSEQERPLPPEIKHPQGYDHKGMKVILTGGSRGLGRYIAATLARDGADVLINSTNNSKEDANDLMRSVNGREGWGNILWVPGDLLKEDTRSQLVETAMKEYGKIDLLVNNAAITRDKAMQAIKEADLDAVMDIKFKAHFLLTTLVARIMKRQESGHVLSIGSVSAYGHEWQSNYASANAALVGMTLSLAEEVGDLGIRVNIIEPGLIEGTGLSSKLKPEMIQNYKDHAATGKTVKPEEVAELVSAVSSDRFPSLTGQRIIIDGKLRK